MKYELGTNLKYDSKYEKRLKKVCWRAVKNMVAFTTPFSSLVRKMVPVGTLGCGMIWNMVCFWARDLAWAFAFRYDSPKPERRAEQNELHHICSDLRAAMQFLQLFQSKRCRTLARLGNAACTQSR